MASDRNKVKVELLGERVVYTGLPGYENEGKAAGETVSLPRDKAEELQAKGFCKILATEQQKNTTTNEAAAQQE